MKLTEINIQDISNDIIKRVLFSSTKSEFLRADCLLVFGCHLKPLLDERLETAIKVLKNKNISKVLLSGGLGVNGDFNEAEYMKKVLLDYGIKESDILIEDNSTTTEENISNSIQILKKNNLIENKNIVLVSSQAHLRRIGMEFQKQLKGINFKIIYEYPEKSSLSFDNILMSNELKNIAINEVKKIVSFINKGIIDDEEIDQNLEV